MFGSRNLANLSKQGEQLIIDGLAKKPLCKKEEIEEASHELKLSARQIYNTI